MTDRVATTSARRGRAIMVAMLTIAIAAIFVVDTVTDYAIAAAVFYVAVILLATRLLRPRSVVILASLCGVLTILSFVLTHSGLYEVGIINTAISIVAIAVTAYLSLKLVAAEAAIHDARERLMRIARVTSLGELTASIAHEVNQPLAAVMTSAGACQRWLAADPPNIEKAERAAERIVAEASRASEVIARVRGLASGKAPMRGRFVLNALVHEIVDLARGQIDRHDILLRLYLPENLPAVFGDRVQIGQVIGNLLLNAIDAVIAEPARGHEIEVIASITKGGQGVTLAVADSGIGFRAGEAERLFDAFWTTKQDGIGLGLTISRAIIEANGGRIWAEENDMNGATLFFTLPIARADTPGETAA
ncbi:HAMP domain-containing sensor histidine kinase [uncultured Sphingomonas sp.]|uniref:sensor histidine kinase n=1 Tax=uncultured Sphingomonas sp. TaxID=158754 RepID=UPI00260947CD|nr:HAMP domain-containing sensor histidine kinase [uncultured Sphingomonas sp.]